MHKNFVIGLVLAGVFLCGMAFHAMIRGGSSATDLANSHQKILSKAGVADSDYQHLFVAVKGEAGSGASLPITVNHVGGDVWGVRVPSTNVAEFTASVNGDVVSLDGTVDSEMTAKELEAAAKKATGIKRVENRLVVGANVLTPEWKTKAPVFLTNFLSESGAKRLVVEGNGLKLEGEMSPQAKERLNKQAVGMVLEPTLVVNELVPGAKTLSSILIAKKRDGEVELNGLLSSEDYRTKLVGLLNTALPDTTINDNLKVESNVANPWWSTNAENLVPMFLTALEADGSIEYWKNHLLVSGTTGTKEISDKLVALASEFGKPEEFSIENDLRLVPTEMPEVTLFRDKKGLLTVQGQVASTIFKNQILGGLMRHNPKVEIEDKLAVKDTVKDLYLGDPGVLVKELMFNAKDGVLKITKEGIKMAGEAGSPDIKANITNYATAIIGKQGKVDSVLTIAKSLVGSSNQRLAKSSGSSEVNTNDPEAANVNFKALAVYFNSGRSSVRESQLSNIRLTARILRKKIPNTKVIVGGYADHRGNKSFNRQLSLNRANAVRELLVSYGVPRDRMVVEYFGENVSGAKSRDLWKSRRVELSLYNQ